MSIWVMFLGCQWARLRLNMGKTGADGETDKITQFFIDVQQGDIRIDTVSVKQAIEYAELAPDNAELGNGTNYIWDTVTTTVS